MSTRWSGEAPVDVTVYRSSEDGSLVVEIDQEPHDDMRIRVNLNDGVIFDGDTEEVSVLDPTEARMRAAELEVKWESGDLAEAVRGVISFLRGESHA